MFISDRLGAAARERKTPWIAAHDSCAETAWRNATERTTVGLAVEPPFGRLKFRLSG